MSYRFYGFNIEDVNLENYSEILPKSLAYQIEIFLPPEGSFATPDLQRYLRILKTYEEEDEGSSMTLANRLRVAFRDLKPDTICGKFPQAELPLKRRLRCVAEYLIRSNEFRKLRDENGKLIKRKGVLGKMVVIYQPEPKLLESLRRQDLLQ
jgi:hypothetical protein